MVERPEDRKGAGSANQDLYSVWVSKIHDHIKQIGKKVWYNYKHTAYFQE